MNQKITIFLIDDDLDDQEIFSFILEEAFIQADCVYANDGIYALEKIRDVSFIPHIIFIDINMPRLNGVELLKELKKINRLLHIPIYMYSTSAEEGIIQECKKLGASGFIKKNTNTDITIEELQQIIAKHKLQL